ncbi:MAG: PorT family protein [Bacteroidales bacterium]|nr:PorT family protein [Bacteroidales bacterium]
MKFNERKPCISILMLLLTLSIAGQDQAYRIEPWEDAKFFNMGYSLGLNLMNFRINPSEEFNATDSLYPARVSRYPGINIHLVANFRLNQFFDIRLLPGVSFGQRVINFDSESLTDTITYGPQKMESSFIEIPLLVKYGWRMQDIKPYIIGGVNYRHDFYAKDAYRLERPVYLRLNRPDLYFEFGAGIDFYLTHIRLSVELKMSNGVKDMLVHDPHPDYPQYCNAIEKLKSRIWVLSFHFE